MPLRSIFALVACSVALLFHGPNAAGQPAHGITREVYANIAGNAVSDLTSHPSFPNSPVTEEVLTTSFDCPVNYLDSYGQRLRALIVPPITGNYVFWIASDDGGQLWLSTNANPANKQLIARVNAWTSWKEWTKEANQQSAPIPLVAGQQYYIEALSKEGAGGDNLTVRWQLPGGAIEEPIPASRCIPFGVGGPAFLQQPGSLNVIEGGSATFSVKITRSFGATLQWQRNGIDIPGATGTNYTLAPVSLGDSGATFRCVATNPYGATNSAGALLTVSADVTPPAITSVGNLGDSQLLTVLFSEPVDSATATAIGNYTINNGITVLSATFGADNRTILLGTTPLASGSAYTLTVNNVRDRASTPNTIAPNTQRTFSITARPLDAAFLRPQPEPIGPSSRRGGLILSEVMYHPTNRFDGRVLEFIEIYNTSPWFEEMGGYRIDGDIEFTFPSNFVLAARSYAVIAANPADVQAVYGIAGVLGPWSGTLANNEGSLRLRTHRGAILFEMNYTGEPPYPAAADGGGHSLVLARPSFGEGDARAWAASELIGGTPRAAEPVSANPLRSILINEFLAHTDAPEMDYIELYNYSPAIVNLAGCVLTDDPDTNKFVIPAGTTIPPNGFRVFYETNLGFALSADGEAIFLKNPQNTRVLDAVRFDGQENGVATGRYPDGAPAFSRLEASTPGNNNAPIRLANVVINEIMFDPASSSQDDEFIELHNRGATAANIGGWRIRDAVSFNIPNGTTIPAGGYIVIARNAARLRAIYPWLTAATCVGNYSGALANSGERIELNMPDDVVSTNGAGQAVTNTIRITVDEVTYRDGGRWGRWPANGGSSLELTDARADRRLAPNWAESDESAKSQWTVVETTGVMDHGYSDAHQLHITLLGAGECLIDDVEVVPSSTGMNVISNGTFEAGTAGWVFQGNHNDTSWEPGEGFASSASLRLRTAGRGDTGANRIRAQLPSTLPSGSTVTLRAKVRWLKGNPNVLLRLRGNWLEAPAYALTTQQLGTPGMVNTAAVTNAGPAITDVAHWPPLPASNQPVLVTTRVHDSDGIATLVLKYRIDPDTNHVAMSMTNNGAGLFSAVIPGQAANAMAAFHIQASDKLDPARPTRFPSDAPIRECIVRWGDTSIPGTLPTFRFWITQERVNQWSAEEKMSNKPKDVTFVYGTNRVVYNAGAWFHGSPYHSPSYNSPVGNSCDYDMGFPSDDRLFGETDINLFRPGNGGGDGTAQTEIQAHWFAQQFGLPYLFHRPVFVFANGLRRGVVYHDAQQPNGDFIDQWFADDADGELHKIQLGFEFGDTAYGAGESGFAAIGANLARYTTSGGVFKQARYRQTWPLRSVSPTQQNNYTNIFALVNTVLTTSPINSEAYTATLTNAVDVEEWYKVHVTQHLYNNTDSFSYGGGQNAFSYKPERDTWKLFLWDVDFAFGGNASDANLFNIGGADHGPRNDHAPFRRIYWQALIEAANGFMAPSRSDPILDARYNGLVAAGASVSSPQNIKTFIATKRSVILEQVAANQFPFAITSNGGNDITTEQNLVTLTGTAPLHVRTIEVNGVAAPLTWTTLSNWTLRVALPAGTNLLAIAGYDPAGNVVAGSSDTIRVTVTAPAAPPQDFIVINEIMFHPPVPGAEYVELFNASPTAAFDISNWRLDGIAYTFPEGTVFQPRSFIVIARDRIAFAAAYGTNVVPFVFAGNLQLNGETLTLIRPGLTPATDTVIDRVRYDGVLPWPYGAPGVTASVQVIDPRQDNSRVGNWSGASPLTASAWRFASATATLPPGSGNVQQLLVYLSSAGEMFLDDISLVTGSVPGAGQNLVRNGDFESELIETPPVSNSWVVGTLYTNSARTTAVKHSGNSSLRLVSTGFGNTTNSTLHQTVAGYPGSQPATLSFWYLPTNGPLLAVRLRNTTLGFQNFNVSPTAGPQLFTPGATNSHAATLPPFPALWLNEVQAENITGITDSAGDRDPWIELHNAGTNTVALEGLMLSPGYTNLAHWTFPAGATIAPGEFKVVFVDGETNETTATELHAGFRLPAAPGSIALSRLWNGDPQIVDYVNYNAGPDHSYGSFPDGQPFSRQEFYFVTPAATNNGTLPPVIVSINEWMADNTGAITDPEDGNFEDWFELYNPGSNDVSLAGYFLTDTLANKFKFEIPEGYSIPAGGYLLVWADGEPAQNNPLRPDLHADFSLARGGETLGLFTPQGIQIDAVTFGAQSADVSEGRFPDASTTIISLTNYSPAAPNFIALDNRPPVLAAIPDKTVLEGEPLTFAVVATDPDFPAQPLTWSLLENPAGAVIDPANGLFGWQPPELPGASNFTVRVRVTDNGNPPLSDTNSFAISVLKTNSRPTLITGGNQAVNEGALLTFSVSANDFDIPAQRITFSLDSQELPPGATINATNGLFTWEPTELHGPAVYGITIRATDDGTPPLSDVALITVVVNESNAAPTLAAITNRTAALGEVISFTAQASDPDLPAQELLFDFSGEVPSGATINPTNGVFSWTANQDGTNSFAIRVTDSGAPAMSDTKAFEIVVTSGFRISSIRLTNDSVALHWGAVTGRTYAVEYKNSLSDANWLPLHTNIVPASGNASASDAVGTNAQRIYRIVLEPAAP